MAWGIIMTGLTLGAMFWLLVFAITSCVEEVVQGLPATDLAGALGRPLERTKAA